MSVENLVLDTTVLEDYFSLKNENVKKWFDGVFTENQDNVIILHSIFLEFIRRSHYHKDDKTHLRDAYRLFRANPKISFVTIDELFIKKMMKNMENIPLIPKIHFGEFSMINNSIIPNTIIVSSDKNALKIYKTNVRINPESDPVKTYRIGSIPK
jgi:hypothetical protein